MMRSTRWTILLLAVLLSLLGVLSIYSSTYQKEGLLWQSIYQRQILWVLLGLVLFFLLSRLDYLRLWDFAYFFYAAAILLLLLVFALGSVRLGAQRWIKIAWFNLQPAEVAKLAVVILLARYFSRKAVDDFAPAVAKQGIFSGVAVPLIYAAVPIALIIEQPDLGSAMMIFLIFLLMLYLTGLKMRYIIILAGLALVAGPFLWQGLRPYQRERIMVFLNPNIDPLGAGYTVIQSKIAIGSGGTFGKGWLSGTQGQLHFLPEAHTDFIFASFAEERGLLGASCLLLLYYLLLRQGLKIAGRTSEQFGRLLAQGVSFMLGWQIFLNVAMNCGLAPVVGLPLPLMSYGGSSVLVSFAALGILASIERRRTAF
jgi:rod shape determining protein RodA